MLPDSEKNIQAFLQFLKATGIACLNASVDWLVDL